MHEDPWYAKRRARWKPEKVRLLLIAESAPDDGGDEANRRFFYDDDLTGRDGLFRQVVSVLFESPELKSGSGAKVSWLEKLRDRGVYLIDLASVPVNYHSRADRAAALQRNIESTVTLVGELAPDGIVLIKKNVFEMLHEPLSKAGLLVLHDTPIPFPASGRQLQFRELFQAAVEELRPTYH